MSEKYTVFYGNCETQEQPAATSLREALDQCHQYDNPTAVWKHGETLTNVSKQVAFLWLEDLMKNGWLGRDEDPSLPDFVETHLTESDIGECIADEKTWKENPA